MTTDAPREALRRWAAALVLCLFAAPVLAVEPGVDVAVPRVPIITVNDTDLSFHPMIAIVDQGDYVRWEHTGTTVRHTTTHGLADYVSELCRAFDPPLWDAVLWPPDYPVFTRQFNEAPGRYTFCCSAHITIDEGSVEVLAPIELAVSGQETPMLSWIGHPIIVGVGDHYRVWRSYNPAFVGADTIALQPDGGDTGTTFLDTLTQPVKGAAVFYLVEVLQ